MNAQLNGQEAPDEGVRPFNTLVGHLGDPVIAPGAKPRRIYPADQALRAQASAPLPDVTAERRRRDGAEMLRRQQLDAQPGGN